MPLTGDVIRRAALIAHDGDADFLELVGMAEIDRATAFRGASMRRTDLRGQNLAGFDFTGADFSEADVRGADFSNAVGLTPEMFHNAHVDQTTIWPDGLNFLPKKRTMSRLKLELPQVLEKSLTSLMDKTDANSRSDVIRKAISVLDWASDEAIRGNRIVSIDKENNIVTRIEIKNTKHNIPLIIKNNNTHNIDVPLAVNSGAPSAGLTENGSSGIGELDFKAIVHELEMLRKVMRNNSTEITQDVSVAQIAMAEIAAKEGDELKLIERLRLAGKWALDSAVAIGAEVVARALMFALK